MNHARRVLKQELEILTDTRRQVMADRDLPGRSAMLVELSCEINEVRQALVALAPVAASMDRTAGFHRHEQRMGEGA